MILVDSRKLRFLQTGRTVHVYVARPRRVGCESEAGVRPEHPIVRVKVLDCVGIIDGDFEGYRLEIRQDSAQPPRYLSKRAANLHPYTEISAKAARDRNGPIEALDASDLARYAREAFKRDDAIRRERAEESQKRRTRRYSVASSFPVKRPASL